MDELFTPFGISVLQDRYLTPGETIKERFKTIAKHYADNDDHAARMYGYMMSHWFMPATPIISNGGTNRGLPISCYLNTVIDSMDGITVAWTENAHLSASGGGIGTDWSQVRSLYENTKTHSKSSGIIPFIQVMDRISLAVNQGSLRRGAASVYLDISHPEIEEFIDLRKQTGETSRRAMNLHHGVVIPDEFMRKAIKDEPWDLLSPVDKRVIRTVQARGLWEKILATRLSNQEPYILWSDTANRNHIIRNALGLKVTQSNLCSEITLPTGIDHLGNNRSAVCCLGSVNLLYWDKWKKKEGFIYDCLSFLDNVLSDFIAQTGDIPKFKNVHYSAMRERSVGLGVMGFHSYLQTQSRPFDSPETVRWNKDVFSHIKEEADRANVFLGADKEGYAPDAIEAGCALRFSNMLAIAPTANISIIAGGCSPGIEPIASNIYTHKTLSGSFIVKNKQLEDTLLAYGMDNERTWDSILENNGSVQHLKISEYVKEVFKTAHEIDQSAIIRLAGDRASMIDQSQSVNLFLPTDISTKVLNQIHIDAWRRGVKSLYYVRPFSKNRVNFIPNEVCELKEECQACQ